MLAILALYLQGIQQNRFTSEVEVVDSNRRCRILAEKINDIENGAELKDWIFREIRRFGEDIEWIVSIAKMVEYRELTKYGLWLWELMQGRIPHKVVHDNAYYLQVAVRIHSSKLPQRLHVTLHAHESDRGWLIIPRFPHYSKRLRSQEEAAVNLNYLESLRQQLDEGKGFCCSYYLPGNICSCDPSWRGALSRLFQWAREGKFGDGEWKDLPPECSYGL
jgi:hypothetical protein